MSDTKINAERIRKLDELLSWEGRLAGRWKVIDCKGVGVDPANACWCAMVALEAASDIYTTKDDDLYVIGSGSIPRAMAEFLVEMHNSIQAICSTDSLLDQPTWCGRCQKDLKLREYHQHISLCQQMTEQDHEVIDLIEKNETLAKEVKKWKDAYEYACDPGSQYE